MGIAGNVLAPELIDRKEFIDQQPAAGSSAMHAAQAAAEAASPRRLKRAVDLAKTPEGVVSGSIESLRAQRDALLAHAQALEAARDAPFNPTTAGMLVPDVVTRPDKDKTGGRKRLSDMHGSVTMRNVGGEAQKRRLEAEAAEEEKKEKKRQALEKKDTQQKEAEERAAAFARCEAVCKCGVIPCPWLGFKRCPTCQGIKKGLCKVKACYAARQPLLLGYNPAMGAADGAEGA